MIEIHLIAKYAVFLNPEISIVCVNFLKILIPQKKFFRPLKVDTKSKKHQVKLAPLSPLQTLVCGFFGIAAPKTLLAPFDAVKIFSQVYGDDMKTKLVNQVKTEGFPSLFAGIFCDWIRIPIQSITHYVMYNDLRTKMNTYVADTLAATVAATIFHPIDVIQSLMISNPIKYPSIASTTAYLIREDGFSGLFRGLTPTILGHIPHRSVQLATHFYLKRYPIPNSYLSRFLFTGGVMGFARFATYPFDTTRKKMICDESMRGKSMFEVMKITHKTSGFRGFYNGFGISLVKIIPMIWLQETFTQEMRQFIGRFNYLMIKHHFK